MTRRKRSDVRQRNPSSRNIVPTLEYSLKSTTEGLDKFLSSLKQSGFKDAIQPYHQLQTVLFQQYLLSKKYNNKTLDKHFLSISEISKEIHDILSNMAEIMKEISNLKNIEVYGRNQTIMYKQNDSNATLNKGLFVILSVIIDRGYLSKQQYIRLSKDNQQIDSNLEYLKKASIIEERGWGNGHSYYLSKNAHQQLIGYISNSIIDQIGR